MIFHKKTRVEFFSGLTERHKHPGSVILEVFAFILYFCGLWYFNLISMAVAVVLMIVGFLFPKPEKKIKWIEKIIDWEIDWVKKPVHSALETFGFLILLFAFYSHNLVLFFFAAALIVIGAIDYFFRHKG